MVDTRVEFCGMELRNPLVVSAGNITATLLRIKRAEECGAGAIITKSILLNPLPTKPRFYYEKRRMCFATRGDKRLNLDDGIALIKDAKREVKVPVIANIMGPGYELDGWAKLAQALPSSGADAVELNLASPTIEFTEVGGKVIPLGSVVGQSPELASGITKAVKSSVNMPVICKLPPQASNMVAVAKACIDAGADAISAINGCTGIPGVDIYNDGKPLFSGVKNQSFGGCSAGDMLKCISLQYVAQMAQKIPRVQIVGGGGLYTWEDLVQMLMCGAQLVTVCKIIILKGWDFLKSLIYNLENYMEKMGYRTIADFRGAALNYFVTPDKIEYIDQHAVVDMNLCKECGICTKLSYCEAISIKKGKPVVNEQECQGCSLCTNLCPLGALSMVAS